MCVVSNIGDAYGRRDGWPWQPTTPWPPQPTAPEPSSIPSDFEKIWKQTVEGSELKRLEDRIAVLEELLRKGKEFDAATGQPNCELDEKRDRIRKLAEELGVEVAFP